MPNDNSWDFIRNSSETWRDYLKPALSLTRRGKRAVRIQVSSSESLIEQMMMLVPGKQLEYQDWFRCLTSTDTCTSIEHAEWQFLLNLLFIIHSEADPGEWTRFAHSVLNDERAMEESLSPTSIVDVFRGLNDITILSRRIAAYIGMDLVSRSTTASDAAMRMILPDMVKPYGVAFGLSKRVFFDSLFNKMRFRKKRSRLLLLCLVYLRNSKVSRTEALGFMGAIKEILLSYPESQRIVAALSFFEQVYDDFNIGRVSTDSLPDQVFNQLKHSFSLQYLFSEKELIRGSHADIAAFLLEQINPGEKSIYEDANLRIWREIAGLEKAGGKQPRILLADFSFPYIKFDERFVLEKKEGGWMNSLADVISRQYIEMQFDKLPVIVEELPVHDERYNVEAIYRRLDRGRDRKKFDIILIRTQDQEVQYVDLLAKNGKFLYSSIPDKELRKDSVKTEMGSLIHRLSYYFSFIKMASLRLQELVPRPDEVSFGEQIEKKLVSEELYKLMDSTDAVISNLKLRNIRLLEADQELSDVNISDVISNFYKSRRNLYKKWFSLMYENNLTSSNSVRIDVAAFYGVLGEILNNAKKYAFQEMDRGSYKYVSIKVSGTEYSGDSFILISIRDNGLGSEKSEEEFFTRGKTAGSGTGQGGDDVYSLISSFGGKCHLREKSEMEDGWNFTIDILLPLAEETHTLFNNQYPFKVFTKNEV